MREDDDPQSGQAEGSLADGLGQTPGDASSPSDAYGDDDIDDGAYGDGADDGDDGTDATATADDVDSGDDLDTEAADLPVDSTGGHDGGPDDPLAEDNSPVEGIGFLLDELHDALFGEDDEGAASDLVTDPADLTSGTDLDLTGDGVVDAADLHEAESPLDFDVDGLHDGHQGHDGGVIDA